MKKSKLKKLIAIIVAISLFSSCCTMVSFAVNTISTTPPDQSEALCAYEKLGKALGLDGVKDNYEWPSEYAGCYIDDDNNLVICVTDDSAFIREKYHNICGKNIKFKLCDYSMDDFLTLYNELVDYDNGAQKIRVGYNSQKNKVIIFVEDEEEQGNIEKYMATQAEARDKTVINEAANKILTNFSCATEFVESLPGNYTETTNGNESKELGNAVNSVQTGLKPGSKISNSDFGFTLGVWAYKNMGGIPVYGIVTCGHSFYNDLTFEYVPSRRVVYKEDTTSEIGVVQEQNAFAYTTDGLYDCAFVEITNLNYEKSSVLATSGNTLTSLYWSAVNGMVVYIEGQVTGRIWGYVSTESILGSDTLASGTVVDFENGSGNVMDGDSGGPAYVIVNGTCKLVGFQSDGFVPIWVSGTNDSPGYNCYQYAAIADANTNLTKLGVTIYGGW